MPENAQSLKGIWRAKWIETFLSADNALLLTINHTYSAPTVQWGATQSLYGNKVSKVLMTLVTKTRPKDKRGLESARPELIEE